MRKCLVDINRISILMKLNTVLSSCYLSGFELLSVLVSGIL